MPIANKKPKVVIDTNVFVSSLNFGGKPEEILDLCIEKEIAVVISSFIVREIEKILREKFKWSENKIYSALKIIKDKTIRVEPKKQLNIIKRKPSDNRILECAVEGGADFIISGDKRHILPLKEFRGIKILSPTEFLNLFQKLT